MGPPALLPGEQQARGTRPAPCVPGCQACAHLRSPCPPGHSTAATHASLPSETVGRPEASPTWGGAGVPCCSPAPGWHSRSFCRSWSSESRHCRASSREGLRRGRTVSAGWAAASTQQRPCPDTTLGRGQWVCPSLWVLAAAAALGPLAGLCLCGHCVIRPCCHQAEPHGRASIPVAACAPSQAPGQHPHRAGLPASPFAPRGLGRPKASARPAEDGVTEPHAGQRLQLVCILSVHTCFGAPWTGGCF